jgi:hypothetical protein
VAKQRPMTEAEWLAAENPGQLLRDLQQHRLLAWMPGVRRHLRLFACACCRSVWEHFHDERCRRAVEVSERYADGDARRSELDAARKDAEEAEVATRQQAETSLRRRTEAAALVATVVGYRVASTALWTATTQSVWRATENVARAVQELRAALAEAVPGPRRPFAEALRAEARAQAALVRDVFGNPFRLMIPLDPSRLAWNGGTIPAMAERIYNERDWTSLPVLADALEDAGCSCPEILTHCRGPGPHVRGCWVLDLLLEKE